MTKIIPHFFAPISISLFFMFGSNLHYIQETMNDITSRLSCIFRHLYSLERHMPFKAVQMAENTAKTAGNIVHSLLNVMQVAAEHEKETNRNWREKMRNNFSQRK